MPTTIDTIPAPARARMRYKVSFTRFGWCSRDWISGEVSVNGSQLGTVLDWAGCGGITAERAEQWLNNPGNSREFNHSWESRGGTSRVTIEPV
jgi:hypothetical protein